MNWGKGIVIGMVLFILFIVCLGSYMFVQPDDYDKQYYEKGLAFDADYAKEKQVVTDKAQPTVQITRASVLTRFVQPAIGKVHFVRPSDRHLDRVFDLQTNDQNVASIPLTDLTPGQWQLVYEWKSGSKQYLYKQEVFVP